MSERNKIIIAGAVLILVVYFLFFRKGNKDKQGQKAILNNTVLQSGYLNKVKAKFKNKILNFRTGDKPVKDYFAVYYQDQAKVTKWAEQIWNAKSPIYGIGDKDEKVLGVFTELQYLSEVAQLSDEFNFRYKRNLADFLDFMDNNNLTRLKTMIDKLPTGLYKEDNGKWVSVNILPVV